ncbi:MAG: hypothetical protein PUB46_10120 [Lachnospiraceae bacterium]|nr:hypothetical protein [Lachnospiraceae bacterium]
MQKRLFALFYMLLAMGMFFTTMGRLAINKAFANESFWTNIESNIESVLPGKAQFREIYGCVNRIISPNEIAENGGAIIRDKEGFLEKYCYVSLDVKDEENKILELNEICEKADADFVYVSYPSKTDDDITTTYYGIETNGKENRNEFLTGLERKNINILDVRAMLEADGYDVHDLFYKTDHHWKSTAGLYGANAIVNYLNQTFGYTFRDDLIDETKFEFTTYDNLWLGETGRRVSKTWARVLDDFTEITPTYETSLSIGNYGDEERTEGEFSMLIDESGYDGNIDLYNYSAHYSYKGSGSMTAIHNNNVDKGKVLIIKDSFSVVVIPFLSLAVQDVVVWDMRATKDGLYDFIEQNDFDAVILAYSGVWNFEMFQFN